MPVSNLFIGTVRLFYFLLQTVQVLSFLGILQKTTPGMDGVPEVTQVEIATHSRAS